MHYIDSQHMMPHAEPTVSLLMLIRVLKLVSYALKTGIQY
jgi:hypothetical protein